MACAFQQKIIGEQMGTSVWVKSRVGLNSHAVKAIRLILQRPGLDRGKVMILVGGPDWPTSVLTGILRLPYLGMMIGTLPILLPVAFTVVAGGCMLKTDQVTHAPLVLDPTLSSCLFSRFLSGVVLCVLTERRAIQGGLWVSMGSLFLTLSARELLPPRLLLPAPPTSL